MKKFKKLVALLLAMMMVFSIAPVAAFAEGYLSFEEGIVSEPTEQKAVEQEIGVIDLVDPDGAETYDADSGSSVLATVIAGSDFQNPNGNEVGAQTVTNILTQMKNDGHTKADGFLFCGDYDYSTVNNQTRTEAGITALKNAVTSTYDTLTDDRMVFVQGNHDAAAAGGLATSGAHDADGYGVYVINEDDYMWRNSDEARIKQTAENLSVYLAAKIVEKYAKPIFVVSHLPLHYNMRTKNDGDGKYANYIFDVLNAAGENGLNIIFLYGHDHSNGWDDYLGGSCVYLAKGDEINIAQSSQKDFAVKTLNFSYLNAGFVGYYENHNRADDTLTMTAFKIYSNKVVVSRYSDSGVHNLKCEGVANSYKNESGYYPNTAIVESPKNITLTEVNDIPALTINGKPVSEYSVDRATVESIVLGLQNFGGYSVSVESSNSDIAAVNVNDYTVTFPGQTGTVTITATGTPAARAAGDSVSATLDLTVTDSGAQSTEPSETIYMFVGETVNRTISGEYLETSTNNNPAVVSVNVTGVEEVPSETTSTEANVTVDDLISSDKSSWTDTGYYYKADDGNYYPVYAKRSSRWSWSSFSYIYTYTWGYSTTGSTDNVTQIGGTQSTKNTSDRPNITVYNTPTTTPAVPANTTVTFTGRAAGTSVVKVGTHTYTIIVREKVAANDYPEYPNEGSVRVEKTGQGVDFQETGVAQIELSTTGVPMTKGVDVILMLDTSSSMNNTVDGSKRIDVLHDSVANMLATFNTPDATTGVVPDIRVAIADFNGYEVEDTNSPIYLDSKDHLKGDTIRDGTNSAKVYTGTEDYTSGAFVAASTYNTAAKRTALVNSITTASGTNYDAAFYYSYQLGQAITEANNTAGEERDLYVVFMSDGAPFQYNGFSAHSNNSAWNNWLRGTNNDAASGSHRYFYNENGNRNWWAEAIKGDEAAMYTVIDKTSAANYGGNQYMTQVAGLGAKMYSIGFCLEVDQAITVASMENVLQKIATDQTYYYKADSAADLNNAFAQIAGNIKKAGYDATFTDVMGEAYDLKITSFTANNKTVNPTITVSTYQLYKKSEVGTKVNGVTVTEAMVGTRKSDTPAVQETVTFNVDGTAAYSDKIDSGNTNILTDNKIKAKLFTYDFEKKTFSWNVGDITEDEQVLTYYVYLTGSMEGTRAAGSYPTNKSAVLTYKNWLDHDAQKDTVSPVMPWASAHVSYAFYLVDNDGKPIVNQTTGETGSFANAVKVTQPVVYREVLLNSTADVQANLVAKDILPAGYDLYDSSADYVVAIKSSGEGSWTITKGPATATTYVAQYDVNDSAAVTNELNSADVNDGQNDYTHTIVWFAVKYRVSTVPDAVVIDFGLPVDISVLANDILGENASVEGLAANVPEGTVSTKVLADGFGSEYTGTYGTAVINGKKVRYTPNNMEMNNTEKFAYAAKAAMASDSKYYYSTVTVIPAANVYYEDSFVIFNHNSGEWVNIGQTEDGITQQEDRPGQFSLSTYDANNVYGYDAAYTDCTTYSLGSAKKVTVSASTNANAPTAVFTFTGTGFDLISLTSNRTGTILVDVIGNNGVEKHWIVDTYYGYVRTQDETNPFVKCTWTCSKDGEWHVVKEEISTLPDGAVIGGKPAQSGDSTYEYNYKWTVVTTDKEMDNALYQIPVIRGQGLEYGTYTVTVTPKYSTMFDHAGAGSYDFYLDAVRIYDPAGTNPGGEIGDAYKADDEGWPDIIEIRNNIINASTLSVDQTSANGIVFVDGVSAATFEDYNNYGPNNEVYLAKGQAIAFKLNVADYSNIDSIQIAAKAPAGTSAIAQVSNGTPTPIVSATEMYYTITHRITWSGNTSDTIVVANTGEGLLSLTNIKITYKEASESDIKVMADNRLLQEAPAILMDMLGIEAPVEEKTFEPEMLEASWNRSTVRKGDKATLTVKASEDVEAIEVDGTKIDSYRTRSYRTGWGRNAKKVTYREFKYSITAAESKEFAVTALNEEGTASAPVITEFKVKPKSNRPIRDWFDDLFGRWR